MITDKFQIERALNATERSELKEKLLPDLLKIEKNVRTFPELFKTILEKQNLFWALAYCEIGPVVEKDGPIVFPEIIAVEWNEDYDSWVFTDEVRNTSFCPRDGEINWHREPGKEYFYEGFVGEVLWRSNGKNGSFVMPFTGNFLDGTNIGLSRRRSSCSHGLAKAVFFANDWKGIYKKWKYEFDKKQEKQLFKDLRKNSNE